jgi:Na+/proline symporter
VVTTTFVIFPEWRPFAIHAGLYGLAVNTVCVVVVSLMTGRPLPEAEARFLETAAGEPRA